MSENAGLIRVSLVNGEDLQPALARLLVEPGSIVIIKLEPVAGAAWIGMAIPLPRANLVNIDLALHLLNGGRLVNLVLGLVPVVIGGEVALAQSPAGIGEVVDLIARLCHQPAWQDRTAAAGPAFENLPALIAMLFGRTGYTGDHDHFGLR